MVAIAAHWWLCMRQEADVAYLRRWGVACVVSLALGNLLLLSALFAPWAVLTSGFFGLPPSQDVSPFAVLWSAATGAPTIVGGSVLVGMSLGYLGGALVSGILSIRLVRAAASSARDASLAMGGVVGAACCGLCGVFALVMLFGLPLVYPYPDVILMPGAALPLLGVILTFSGLLARLSTTR